MSSNASSALGGNLAARADAIYMLIATMVGGALRLPDLGKNSLWTDELYLVWEGRHPLSSIFDPQLHIQHPPGYRLVQHIWMGAGLSEAWIRLLPALCGVALVPVVWAIARALWPGQRLVAAFAALLAATSPFLIHYSRDATAYSWSALWVAISFLLLVHAWHGNCAWTWAAWSASLAIGLYSHYFNFFPLALECIAALGVALFGDSERRPRLRPALLAVLGAVALYAPWLWILGTANNGTVAVTFFPLTVDTQILHWVLAVLLGYPHANFWQKGLVAVALWLLILAAMGWAMWRVARRREAPLAVGLAMVAGWALAGTIGPYLFLRVTTPPDVTDPVRFATMSAPALLIGASWLLAQLPRPAAVPVLLCWIAVTGVQNLAEYTSPAAQDWRSVLGTVATEAKAGDALLAFPAFHAGAAAAYYSEPLDVEGGWFVEQAGHPTGAAYWFAPGWHWQGYSNTNAEQSADMTGEIAARTGDAGRLWYLAGDGVDGTYPSSRAAEDAISSLGWRPLKVWHLSPLVLRLYTRSAGSGYQVLENGGSTR